MVTVPKPGPFWPLGHMMLLLNINTEPFKNTKQFSSYLWETFLKLEYISSWLWLTPVTQQVLLIPPYYLALVDCL